MRASGGRDPAAFAPVARKPHALRRGTDARLEADGAFAAPGAAAASPERLRHAVCVRRSPSRG